MAEGTRLLRGFLIKNHVTQNAAAEAIGVSSSTMSYWLRGSIPVMPYRVAIERFTKGAVPVASWKVLTPADRASNVRPFGKGKAAEPEAADSGQFEVVGTK